MFAHTCYNGYGYGYGYHQIILPLIIYIVLVLFDNYLDRNLFNRTFVIRGIDDASWTGSVYNGTASDKTASVTFSHLF